MKIAVLVLAVLIVFVSCAKEEVTDEILDQTRPIAGTPQDCIDAITEYREAGCTHIMLELWGDDRDRQLEVFGREVLPRFRD